MTDHISKVIRECSSDAIVFVPNPGNAGDSFIAHCTYNFFDKIDLKYSIGEINKIYNDKVIICGGGGSLVEPYREMYDFIKRNKVRGNRIIVLPQSIRAYPDMISMLDEADHIYCREKRSFDYVNDHSAGCNVHLAHDMAFSWDPKTTLEKIGRESCFQISDMELFLRNSKRIIRRKLHNLKSFDQSTLVCYRNDVERTDIKIPFANFDMSQLFSADNLGRSQSLWATWHMMSMISSFDTICTNRLHVAIMSLLLKKKTVVSDNSYGKLKSVLDFSFEKWPDNLTFNDVKSDQD
ncbi:MAG: polysaccharide pyruvyl transferase family protein [Alphaproteobacteria bacterium]|nr:polysaccharide pyruvyl transferase family protein [Alphaproteobacteria bacterium]MBU0864375.1 polysaccharide pyruvyl transferase family protein [Alphaproteobacteria bacterium]MBU1825616.1 polysaccharide pyruvyl transferase family protein [Alphaproteobacteria bacterium]